VEQLPQATNIMATKELVERKGRDCIRRELTKDWPPEQSRGSWESLQHREGSEFFEQIRRLTFL
jgi:hypothetical protein